MTPQQITLVSQSWQKVVPIADQAVAMFYGRLFESNPDLQGLFDAVDMTAQGRKLAGALNLVVSALERFDEVVPTLEDLGRRHAQYGVRDAHYDAVGEALLWTLEQGLGDDWSDAVSDAWATAYGAVAGVMRAAAAARGYWIVRVSVRDAQRYPDYLRAAKPAFDRFGARFLVRGGDYEACEGTARERNVVVEFKDVETARACYDSPEYRAAREIRNVNADSDLIIVEGLAGAA